MFYTSEEIDEMIEGLSKKDREHEREMQQEEYEERFIEEQQDLEQFIKEMIEQDEAVERNQNRESRGIW